MAVVHNDPIPAWLVEPTEVAGWLEDSDGSAASTWINGDLLAYAPDPREAFSSCNTDKSALRRLRETGSRSAGC